MNQIFLFTKQKHDRNPLIFIGYSDFQYVGRTFLESHGIYGANEFAALRHISTWAVCSFPNRVLQKFFTENSRKSGIREIL